MRMGEEDNVDRETLRGNTNMYARVWLALHTRGTLIAG